MTTSPRPRARRALAATLAVGSLCACAPLAGAAVQTTIRIEGSGATLVPESSIPIEADGTQATLFDLDFNPVQVDRGSAFWQVARAASGAGVPFEFRAFSFGLQVLTIGLDSSAGTVGWQYKVNNVSAQVGAESTQLATGDSVLWFHGGFIGARNLDLIPSTDRLAAGTAFTVRVVSYDSQGDPSPAAGASVTYGPGRSITDGAGEVTFIAQGEGVVALRADRAGDVRSATRFVCAFASDPAVCNLPPRPPAQGPAAPAPGAPADTVPPGSTIRSPELGATRGAVRSLAGTAGPDRSDVARVEVSLGLRVGSQCRFRTARGSLTRARSCARPEWVTARHSGTSWILPLGRGLAPGVWRVESRATDGAGNLESVRVPRANIGAFRVRGRLVTPVTRIGIPRSGARPAAVRLLRGTAGPPAADIALVQVALSRPVAGGGCRFVTVSGRMSAVRACANRIFLPARSRGTAWSLPLARPLPVGPWVAVARSRTAEGGTGRPAVSRFTVGRRR